MAYDPVERDRMVATFRRHVFASYHGDITWPDGTNRLILFPHQAAWILASEGWTLLDMAPGPGDFYTDVLIPHPQFPEDPRHAQVVQRAVVPRLHGPARILWDLAAFKGGKSYGAAAWMAGFAIIPKARIEIIGLEYSSAEPEFGYLEEFLCSSRGMGMKPILHHNDPDHGRMKMIFRGGATYLVRSWARKDALKGKKVTAYCYAEAYQLPGLKAFTSVSQNLRELRGFAAFPTTPDRPWVSVGHENGHGRDPEWHCTCCVDASVNPFSYSAKDRARDSKIMTREAFAIAWEGKLGHYVGRVYDFVRGQQQFSPLTHPQIWRPDLVTDYARA